MYIIYNILLNNIEQLMNIVKMNKIILWKEPFEHTESELS